MSAELVNPRSQFVRDRIVTLNRTAGDLILETGTLLREFKEKAYYKEDGFATFEEAIQHWQDSGTIDFGPRNARNFIAVVQLVETLCLDPKAIEQLGISKLREIASLNAETDQRRLLNAAPDMSVSEVQAEAKKIRDHAKGYDVDPLVGVPFKITATQKQFLEECLLEARRVYGIDPKVPSAEVLVDSILPEWYAMRQTIEHQEIEAAV